MKMAMAMDFPALYTVQNRERAQLKQANILSGSASYGNTLARAFQGIFQSGQTAELPTPLLRGQRSEDIYVT